MKGKKPTNNQRKVIERNGLDPTRWYVQKDTPNRMQVVDTHSGETKELSK